MVTAGRVKVLDFGLAKLVETDVSEGETTEWNPLTEDGMIVGTAAYMSPEQAQGRRVDARSDIFSFGSVLYEMVTGQRAFSREGAVSTLAAVLKEEPRPPSELVPALPRELERLIQACLRKDPARRFQHMDDVRTLLEQLREDSESGALFVAARSARSPSFWLAAVGIALAALVVVVETWPWRRSDDSGTGSPLGGRHRSRVRPASRSSPRSLPTATRSPSPGTGRRRTTTTSTGS